jgi:hypothetical protein
VTLFYNTTEIGKQYIYTGGKTLPKKKEKDWRFFFLKKMEFLPKKINVTFCQNFNPKKRPTRNKARWNKCNGKLLLGQNHSSLI